jgi:hypothetical protein
VLWALARAFTPEDVEPFAVELAQRLAVVSLYDREIHIRRAASAAFQELVGRLVGAPIVCRKVIVRLMVYANQGIMPHGIDVLRKMDFFTVSLRRSAFLVASKAVAE